MPKEILEKPKSSSFKSIKIENEQKLLSYLMRNPNEASEIQDKHLLHETSKDILFGIKTLSDKGVSFDLDTLLLFTQEKNPKVAYDTIKEIYENFSDFTNIATVKEVLLNDYLKYHVTKEILEDILTLTYQKDKLDYNKLKSFAEEILYSTVELTGGVKLKDPAQMAETHIQVIENRDKGLLQRTYGYSDIDKFNNYPAAAGETSVLGALKGTAKSLIIKNIEYILLERNVCVLSLNPEMTEQSNMDRVLWFRYKINPKDINKMNMNPKMKESAINKLKEFSGIKNYLYSDEEYLELDMVDSLIHQAKIEFKRKGVLPDDGYMFVTIDSLDMVQGFDEPKMIKKSIDRVHAMAKKHGVHIMYLVQANENRLRNTKFKTPEDFDKFFLTTEDIYGGSYYAARARFGLMINRPLHLKQRYFPEMAERWELETNSLFLDVIKVNNGTMGRSEFLITDDLVILPWGGKV